MPPGIPTRPIQPRRHCLDILAGLGAQLVPAVAVIAPVAAEVIIVRPRAERLAPDAEAIGDGVVVA